MFEEAITLEGPAPVDRAGVRVISLSAIELIFGRDKGMF